MDTELRISTPNLEVLQLSENPYGKYVLMNMPSLTEANLHFCGPNNNIVGAAMTQILPVVKHVEILSLSASCVKALGAMKEEGRVSSFPNVMNLKLVCCEEYEQIVGVLELFPQLRDFGLRTSRQKRARNSFELETNGETCWLNFDRNLPKSFVFGAEKD